MCLKNPRTNTLSGVHGSFLNEYNSAGVRLIKYASILLTGVPGISMKEMIYSADVRVINYTNILFLGVDESLLNGGDVQNKEFWQHFVFSGTTCAVSGGDFCVTKYNKDIRVDDLLV